MGETRSEELEYMDWFKKVCERMQVVNACIIDRRKMLDTDYDVMEELFRVYNEGRLPLYHRVADCLDITGEQQMLF